MMNLPMALSIASFGLSVVTAWLTLGRRGTVRMGQPQTIYVGPDGAREHHPKVFVQALLYATAARGRIVEGLFVRLTRGESAQSFPIWVCGQNRKTLGRGVGLAVRPDGVALDHHFLLPSDGTTYRFLAGTYRCEIFAALIGQRTALKLKTVELELTEAQAARLNEDSSVGVYFDWSPETRRYHGHLQQARLEEAAPSWALALMSNLAKPEGERSSS